MKPILQVCIFILAILILGCNSKKESVHVSPDTAFGAFEETFLDAYWKQYPSSSILIGYGKYYEAPVLPDSSVIVNNILFSREWLDSLASLNYEGLSDNNKISFNIIKNQLDSDIWYADVFKEDEWDASLYNLSGGCYYIINQICYKT